MCENSSHQNHPLGGFGCLEPRSLLGYQPVVEKSSGAWMGLKYWRRQQILSSSKVAVGLALEVNLTVRNADWAYFEAEGSGCSFGLGASTESIRLQVAGQSGGAGRGNRCSVPFRCCCPNSESPALARFAWLKNRTLCYQKLSWSAGHLSLHSLAFSYDLHN